MIHLNTDSKIRVHYTSRARDVELIKGEALFTVQHDVVRPFSVLAGTAVIISVGSEFDVYRLSARTLVAVIQGMAEVQASDLVHNLKSGERASIGINDQIRMDGQQEFPSALAWEERRLDFDAATLADVAAEFNRYNRRQIVVQGSGLNSMLISGSANVDRPELLLLYVTKLRDDIVVTSTDNGCMIRIKDGADIGVRKRRGSSHQSWSCSMT